MKKKMVLLFVTVAMMITLAGCSSNDNPSYSVTQKDNYMTKVEEGADYAIYVDDQGVMYYLMFNGIGDHSRMAMTAMINPDGTARLWNGGNNND